ncbi:MAG: protoporphyrinogen oxidase, partial [Jatrophihabitans sp.]
PVFMSFPGGLAELPTALAGSGFRTRTRTAVRVLRRTAHGFALECGPVPEPVHLDADAVVIAAPPGKAGPLLRTVAPAASTALGEIGSTSVAVVNLAFRDVTLPAGSGFLVPASERRAIKGATFSSQKWPISADGVTLLRASLGRAGEPTVLQRDDTELVRLVRHELRSLLGVDAEPIDTAVTRWGGGLPQYTPGHVERVARIRAAVADVPGLAVCGAAYDGVGIPACIASARLAADRVLASLTERGQWARG